MVLGFTTCATDTMRAVSEASRGALYPFGKLFGDSELSTLLTSLFVAGLFLLIQFGVTLGYWKCNKKKLKLAPSAGKCRFPSVSVTVSNLLYQVIVLEASLILLREETDDNPRDAAATAICAITLAVCFVLPLLYGLWCKRNLEKYRYLRFDHSTRFQPLAMFVFPVGHWTHRDLNLKRYRALCGMLDGHRHWALTTVLHMRSFIVAVVAAYPHFPCQLQALVICGVFWLYTVVILVTRPLRVRASLIFSPLVSFFSGVIALALFIPKLNERSTSLVMFTTAITVIGGGLHLVGVIVEKYWRKKKCAIYMDGDEDDDLADDEIVEMVESPTAITNKSTKNSQETVHRPPCGAAKDDGHTTVLDMPLLDYLTEDELQHESVESSEEEEEDANSTTLNNPLR